MSLPSFLQLKPGVRTHRQALLSKLNNQIRSNSISTDTHTFNRTIHQSMPAGETVTGPSADGHSSFLNPNSVDFAGRENEIRALKANPATKRAMALGDRYEQLQISADKMKEVEEDFRKARLFEVVTMSTAMREVEMDEQRRLVAERQKSEAALKQAWLEDYHRMRQKAYDVLLHEAETVKAEEQRRLEADKRAILQVERSRLLERRQAFESSTISARIGGGGGGANFTDNRSDRSVFPGTPIRRNAEMSSSDLPPNSQNNVPLLVMSVTLGNGREEKITVRTNDDPKRVAVNFARKFALPDSAAVNLTNQIKAHLSSRANAGLSDASPSINEYSSSGGRAIPASASSFPYHHSGGGGAAINNPALSRYSPSLASAGF